MDCIKCSGTLIRKIVNGVEIEQCNSCGGIWFDLGELDWLLEVPQLQLDDQESGEHKILDNKRSSCPNCGGVGKMIQLSRIDSDFHIDACPTCSGRWLDGGELKALREAERQNQLRGFFNDIQ